MRTTAPVRALRRPPRTRQTRTPDDELQQGKPEKSYQQNEGGHHRRAAGRPVLIWNPAVYAVAAMLTVRTIAHGSGNDLVKS
jgi:hypothetical protein